MIGRIARFKPLFGPLGDLKHELHDSMLIISIFDLIKMDIDERRQKADG